MSNLLDKWNELSFTRRVLFLLRIMLSVIVVTMSIVGLLGLMDTAVTNIIAIPSLGVVLLLSSFDVINNNKMLAVIYFVSSMFILAVSFSILVRFNIMR